MSTIGITNRITSSSFRLQKSQRHLFKHVDDSGYDFIISLRSSASMPFGIWDDTVFNLSITQTSLPYNGQGKSALAFFNERIDSSLSIFKAPEDAISGATPTFMVCPFAI